MSLEEYAGQARPSTSNGRYNETAFAISQQIAKLQTAMPVQVVAVRGGGVAPVGYVDVRPMVQQLTGDGQPIDHGTITNVPYFRAQGGAAAVIIDPAIGDIGIAVFASRDISAVKNARKVAPPGSRRQYDFSDGMYIGGILNGTPTTYVQFTPEGVTIHAATVRIEGDLHVTGTTTTSDNLKLDDHKHENVQPGSGQSGGPVNA